MLLIRIFNRLLYKNGPWKAVALRELSCRYYEDSKSSTDVQVRTYSSNPQCEGTSTRKDGGGAGGGGEEKKGGGKVILALGAIALAGGATLGYAKYDPEFRKTLVGYAPITDTIIKTIFLEEEDLYGDLKKAILGKIMPTKKYDGLAGDSSEPSESYTAPPPIVPAIEKEVQQPEDDYNEIRMSTKPKDDDDEPEIKIGGEVKPGSKETDTKNLCELEKKICRTAEEAVNAYNKAIYVIQRYNQDIEFIIDEAVNHVKPEIWEDIRHKTRSKYECVKRAEEKAHEATRDIHHLKELISRSDFQADETTKEVIRQSISKIQDDINKAKHALHLEQKHGNITEKYWDRVEKARRHFADELEILFPNVDFSKKLVTIKEEELDLFILYTFSHVLFYQKELAKMELLLQNKMNQAIEQARHGGFEPLTMAQICEAVEQEQRRLTLCFQQQLLKLRKTVEAELREKLKLQSQAFNDHLKDALKIKEQEIERVLSRKYDELLESERCKFKAQLAMMIGRLKGLDEAISARNEADAEAKQAHILWASCQTLLRAIRAGCPGLPWKEQMRPLQPELAAVKRAAAPHDELVHVVVAAIPIEAKERGVYPEDALRERFIKVEKVARTMALVPSQGAPLPVHVLSYLQSLLLIKSASPIPQAELSDEQVDFSLLNTNEILQRARYWLERGDFLQTLKYMNLLKGAPRCVARQWMNEARILLETQQAANTLMAHAAASGLVYL